MGKFINMVGLIFGRLVVISRIENYKVGRTHYLCLCECGGVVIVGLDNLRKGKTKSCGCYRNEVSGKRYFIDIKGKRFGLWFVESRAENNKNGKARWNCVCDCGTRRVVTGEPLRRGKTTNCGCLRREMASKRMSVQGENNVSWIGGPLVCGYDTMKKGLVEEVRSDPDNPKVGQVRCHYCLGWYSPTRSSVSDRLIALGGGGGEANLYCSEECKTKCSTYRRQSWRDGENPNTQRDYQQEFRNMVIERDGMCVKCFYKYDRIVECGLEAHHIVPYAECQLFEADIENGITLCQDCHAEVTFATSERQAELNSEFREMLNEKVFAG